MGKTLFDDEHANQNDEREDRPLDRLKNLDEQIAGAVNKVKALKDEKTLLEQKVLELEAMLDEKNREVEKLSSEKSAIKTQIEELLSELESLDVE